MSWHSLSYSITILTWILYNSTWSSALRASHLHGQWALSLIHKASATTLEALRRGGSGLTFWAITCFTNSLFLERYLPGSSFYRIHERYIDGHLDISAFGRFRSPSLVASKHGVKLVEDLFIHTRTTEIILVEIGSGLLFGTHTGLVIYSPFSFVWKGLISSIWRGFIESEWLGDESLDGTYLKSRCLNQI